MSTTVKINGQTYEAGFAVASEIERLRDLVVHCYIHSGYPNCGYAQMTTEQKAMYDAIILPLSE